MFNIGAGEIAVILIAALLLLGPQKLPELARGIGKFLREFRRQTDEVRTVVEREFYQMDQEIQQLNQDIQREDTAPKPALPPSEGTTPGLTAGEGGAPALAEPQSSTPNLEAESSIPDRPAEEHGRAVPFAAGAPVESPTNGTSEPNAVKPSTGSEEPGKAAHPETDREDSSSRGK
jgi:sec-independent protein translocase protein TatB